MRVCMYVYVYVYIYIYIYTANLRTNIMDVRGFDSTMILMLRGAILMSIGNFPEVLSQAMLVECNVIREIGRMTTGHSVET